MGLFGGLEKLGLGGFDKVKLFEDEEQQKKSKKAEKKEVKELEEKDYLLDREYVCQVCDQKFKQRMMRTSKARLSGQDRDLRPIYQGIDPVKYDVIVCPYCGYAVVSRFYMPLAKPYRQLIRDNISSSFKPLSTDVPELISYEDAFIRYKLALLNSVVRQGKNSEKALICLKIAWLLRGWKNSLSEDEEKLKEMGESLEAQEKEHLHNALEGFLKARATEQPPFAGMNDTTLDYLIGALCVELNERMDDGLRLLHSVLTSQNAGTVQKQRAQEMIEEVRANRNHNGNEG